MFNNFFSKYAKCKTTNSENILLNSINGSVDFSHIQLGNLLINGQANLGKNNEKTIFNNIVVVNGNLNAKNSSFEILEVNGNAELECCTVILKGEFFGNAIFNNCTLADLDFGGTKFALKDSIVTGNIQVISFYGRGQLILDNTIVKGFAKFDKNDGDIICINGGKVENNQI